MDIKKCIITAAGKGTRFLPVTKCVTKEMLPILNLPAIYWQVEEAYLSGIKDIIIVVNKNNHELIKRFFTKDDELNEYLKMSNKLDLMADLNEIIDNVTFNFVEQDESLRGSAGALYAARDYIDDEYFALMFCDDLILSKEPFLLKLINKWKSENANVIAISKVPFDLLRKYGLIKFSNNDKVEDFVMVDDVSAIPSDYTLRGRLILHRSIFDNIINAPRFGINEVGIPRVIINMGLDINYVKIEDNYFDIGNPLGLIKANIAYGLKNDKIKIELKNYLDDWKDDKNE